MQQCCEVDCEVWPICYDLSLFETIRTIRYSGFPDIQVPCSLLTILQWPYQAVSELKNSSPLLTEEVKAVKNVANI